MTQSPTRADFLAIANEMLVSAPSKAELEQLDAETGAEKRDAHLRASGIEGAITSEDWAALVSGQGLRTTHALDSVRRWWHVRPKRPSWTMLALLGETGRGKTLAASWLLALLGGRYVTAEELRRLMASNYPAQQQAFREAIRTRVLVLDDAGAELDGLTAAAMLFEVVNHRQGLAHGWTVITANLSLESFSERYGVRTVRRLQHQGALVQVAGEDLRRLSPPEEGT